MFDFFLFERLEHVACGHFAEIVFTIVESSLDWAGWLIRHMVQLEALALVPSAEDDPPCSLGDSCIGRQMQRYTRKVLWIADNDLGDHLSSPSQLDSCISSRDEALLCKPCSGHCEWQGVSGGKLDAHLPGLGLNSFFPGHALREHDLQRHSASTHWLAAGNKGRLWSR